MGFMDVTNTIKIMQKSRAHNAKIIHKNSKTPN